MSWTPAFAGAWRLLFAFLLLFVAPAHAQTFPQLAGEPVVDAANLLDPAQEAALNAKLKGIVTATGHQVAVATIPNLEGRDIADYGYRLLRTWGIGSKDKDDGIILIVAPNERKTRIEVGYGLEAVMTDAYASVIVNSVMIPQFKAGNYPAGIDAGVDEIAKQIQLPPEEAAARAKAASVNARQSNSSNGIPGGFIFWIFIFFFVILPLLRSLGGRRHGSGIGNVILWSALNAAANSRDSGSGWGGGGSDWGGGGGGFSGGGGSGGGGGASGGW